VLLKTPLRRIKIPVEKIGTKTEKNKAAREKILFFVSAILNKIIEHMVMTF